MGSTMGSGSRGSAINSRVEGRGEEGLGSVVCDDEGGSGWQVVDEFAVEGDKVLCTARRFVVSGHWAAGSDPRVGDRRWGDVGLKAEVAGDLRQNRWSAGVRGAPAVAAEWFWFQENIRPDEVRGEVETETPEVDDGETTGGLQAKPGGAPVTTATFSELAGDSLMWSKVEM